MLIVDLSAVVGWYGGTVTSYFVKGFVGSGLGVAGLLIRRIAFLEGKERVLVQGFIHNDEE